MEHNGVLREKLEKQLGDYLRKRRGEMTFAEFSRKVGLPQSTLNRLEQYSQSITLKNLQTILKNLKCKLKDIFPEDY